MRNSERSQLAKDLQLAINEILPKYPGISFCDGHLNFNDDELDDWLQISFYAADLDGCTTGYSEAPNPND